MSVSSLPESASSAPTAAGHRVEAVLSRLGDDLDQRLAEADQALLDRYPGERAGRQPVHTVYVPADRYGEGLVREWGGAALAAMDADAAGFRDVMGGSADLVARVRAKLEAEPVEDLRIDFEDGYGQREDPEEDLAARTAARALAASIARGEAPPFHGIRFKSFEAPTRRRGLRTLALFVEELLEGSPAPMGAAPSGAARALPAGFVVTLPKVTSVEQVEAMVAAAAGLESALGLGDGTLRFEIQVETPQSVLGPDGTALVARMIHASAGRCTALHYGTYDYSASCGVAAAYQSMEHPVADHAKAVMQVAAAGTGVRLSDGSTNVIPVGDQAGVRAAWALHHRLVRRSLERGYYQGWDLHPAQLPTRYAAVFAFYRGGLAEAADRLRRYVERAESGFMDEPATARALADYILRAVDCGAVGAEEAQALTGLDGPALAVHARRAPA